MPIKYQIDREKRLVVATPEGLLSDADMFEYQRTVWSQAELKGYNELFDVTGVTQLESVTEERVADLADLAASMDPADLPSKLAILATNDLHFGLARMYERRRNGWRIASRCNEPEKSLTFPFSKQAGRVNVGRAVQRLLRNARRGEDRDRG